MKERWLIRWSYSSPLKPDPKGWPVETPTRRSPLLRSGFYQAEKSTNCSLSDIL
jgi:hypothetical protein